MTDRPSEVEDKDLLTRDYFDRKQRSYLRTLVSPEVVEEHRRKPLGQHSEPLERLLHYFRERPLAGKYAVLREPEGGGYRIVALSGVRGVPPQPIGEKRFASVEAAYHGIFLERIEELMGDGFG